MGLDRDPGRRRRPPAGAAVDSVRQARRLEWRSHTRTPQEGPSNESSPVRLLLQPGRSASDGRNAPDDEHAGHRVMLVAAIFRAEDRKAPFVAGREFDGHRRSSAWNLFLHLELLDLEAVDAVRRADHQPEALADRRLDL